MIRAMLIYFYMEKGDNCCNDELIWARPNTEFILGGGKWVKQSLQKRSWSRRDRKTDEEQLREGGGGGGHFRVTFWLMYDEFGM